MRVSAAREKKTLRTGEKWILRSSAGFLWPPAFERIMISLENVYFANRKQNKAWKSKQLTSIWLKSVRRMGCRHETRVTWAGPGHGGESSVSDSPSQRS